MRGHTGGLVYIALRSRSKTTDSLIFFAYRTRIEIDPNDVQWFGLSAHNYSEYKYLITLRDQCHISNVIGPMGLMREWLDWHVKAMAGIIILFD